MSRVCSNCKLENGDKQPLPSIEDVRENAKEEAANQTKKKVKLGTKFIQSTFEGGEEKRKIQIEQPFQQSKGLDDNNKEPVGTFNIYHLPPITKNPGKKSVLIHDILPEIEKQSGVADGTRKWCFLVCDGAESPMLAELQMDNPANYGWYILLIPHLHLEMTLVEAFLHAIWNFTGQELCKVQEYYSPKALNLISEVKDFHKAKEACTAMNRGVAKALVRMYVNDGSCSCSNLASGSCQKGCKTGEGFIKWIESVNDVSISNLYKLHMQLGMALEWLHIGIRTRDVDLVQIGIWELQPLFFSGHFTTYDKLSCYFQRALLLMPPKLQEIYIKYSLFSSGLQHTHQGADAIIEQEHKKLLRFLPTPTPKKRDWEEAFAMHQTIGQLQLFKDLAASTTDPKQSAEMRSARDKAQQHQTLQESINKCEEAVWNSPLLKGYGRGRSFVDFHGQKLSEDGANQIEIGIDQRKEFINKYVINWSKTSERPPSVAPTKVDQ
jgi:hypothetical protein